MTQNKLLSDVAVPRIKKDAMVLFEESFLILLTFGPNKFRTHVQTKSLAEQQVIFDTFRLFGLCMTKSAEE